MNKIFLFLIFITTCSYGQFQPNSIGVVYLTSETIDSYQLTIVFPVETLEKPNYNLTDDIQQIIDSLKYTGAITFFDKNGELLTIKEKTDFTIQLWCENDGGIQYRPTCETFIKKTKFKRKLEKINEIQNIACFVIASRTNVKIESPDYTVSNAIKLSGDYNNDGQVDCFLWTYHDDAENCSGEPVNNLAIILQVGKKQFHLRCCGP